MSNVLEYKGYCGTVEYSAADRILFGKVLGINGLISFEGESVGSLKEDFESAVDEYLEICAEKGINPEKAYQGSFNVRVPPELHKSLVIYSASHGQTLNSAVEEAIRRYVTYNS
jgi:predicted HicB family RNase H-like nuclease